LNGWQASWNFANTEKDIWFGEKNEKPIKINPDDICLPFNLLILPCYQYWYSVVCKRREVT